MTSRMLLLLALAGWSLLFPAPKAAAEPADTPILRIETGFHTAMINAGSLSADGNLLLTPSDDKTARLWRLPDFTLVRTFRPNIGAGDEGKLYAAALSPDGKLAALGGWSRSRNHDVYLFSTIDGRLVRRLSGLPNVVNILAFSPDGTKLAAGLWANGIRVWRVEGWRELVADRDYGDQVYGLSFSRDGRLATGSYDGHLRLYGPDSTLRAKAKLRGGERPHRVAFSPDGRHLAVGFEDGAKVEVLAAADMRSLALGDGGGNNISLSQVAWSRDGAALLAGGRGKNDQEVLTSWPWRNGTLAAATVHSTSAKNTIMGLLSHPTGDWIVASSDPLLAHLDGALRPISHRAADTLDFVPRDLSLSPDGNRVGFGLRGSAQRFSFDVAEQRLGTGNDSTLAAPRTTVPGMVVENWRSNRAPRLNNKALGLMPQEESRAAAISGQTLLLGADWSLRRFDQEGKQVWERSVPATTWAVNISGDGRLAAAAHGDGTIRWYHMEKQGKELLALFLHADGKRWVAWTPSGYYAASAGAEDLIGWHVNRGPDQAADFFPIGLFRERFNRPDVVALVLEDLDEAKALSKADAARAKAVAKAPEPPTPPPAPLAGALPPVVEIVSPAAGSAAPDGRLTLSVRVRAAPDAPAHRLRVLRDGSWERDLDAGIPAADGSISQTIPLALSGDRARLGVIAYNRHGQSQVSEVEVVLRSAPPRRKADLYILAVGINAYPPQVAAGLRYARNDALEFMNAMYTQENGLYGMVRPRAIPDAGRDEVLAGLKWLEDSVKPGDVAMVFLSGHGHTDEKEQFYFLTPDTDMARPTDTAVAGRDIRAALSRIKGVRYVFLDACRSGAVLPAEQAKGGGSARIDRFVNELVGSDGGSVVLAASRGSEPSLESSDWNNGAFTKALVEGIRGKAGRDEEDDIRVAGLVEWISRRVGGLTNGRQTPTFAQPYSAPNYVIALRK